MDLVDPWKSARNWLREYLNQEPERERALRAANADELNPADLMFRSLLLEDEGRFEEAAVESRQATERAYLPTYLRAALAERQYVASLVDSHETVVDVASGRGTLTSTLLHAGHRRLVAADVSLLVLQRMCRRAEAVGDPLPMGSVACDAKAVPLASGCVETATTFLGLSNLPDPVAALAEVRRFVTGRFLAVHYFAPGGAGVIGRADCLDIFTIAGWSTSVENEIVAPAAPTPVGVLIEGAQIDAFPSDETELTWCVIVAS